VIVSGGTAVHAISAYLGGDPSLSPGLSYSWTTLFPLAAHILDTTRSRHTEFPVDLCALAGLPCAGLLCDLVNDYEVGNRMRRDACHAFANRFGLPMICVVMLVEHREWIEGIDAQL